MSPERLALGLTPVRKLLCGPLIARFWSAQIGAQYANEWAEGERYTDRWSGAIALQGLAPGKFEVDLSPYVSEKGDFTSKLEPDLGVQHQTRVFESADRTRAAGKEPARLFIVAGFRFAFL